MKIISLYLTLLVIGPSFGFNAAFALVKKAPINGVSGSIYGVDNRRLVIEDKSLEYNLSKSVAAQISFRDLIISENDNYRFRYESLESSVNMCTDEKFSKLPFFSDCTGFLVGKNLLMTAGHCMENNEDCQKKVWSFDYLERPSMYANLGELDLLKANTYRCKEVVARTQTKDANGVLDYALVRLDRDVVDREPLKVRRFKKQKITNRLAIIGHPLGMPKIIVDKFIVRDNRLLNSMVISSDTFSGSSGSPVIDMETEMVVGMLVRGENDFNFDVFSNCNRIKKCVEDKCLGETAVRSTSFPFKFIPFRL